MRYLSQLFMTSMVLILSTLSVSAQDIQQSNLFPQVRFVTDQGDMVVELDRMRAPITVDNFLTYVVAGKYDNTVFHRIIDNFVVQGGGYNPGLEPIEAADDIVNESGNGLKNSFGTIAMARERKPHTASSQFYFNVQDNESLDPSPRRWGYAVFGKVVDNEELLIELASVETHTDSSTGFEDVPVEPIIVQRVELLPRSND